MKRTLRVVLVLLLAVAPGVPWVFGTIARKRFEEIVHGAANAGRLTVLGSEYDTGWLSTDATTILAAPPPPGSGALPVRVALHSTITHGPLPFAELGKYGFEPILTIVHTEVSQDSLPEPLSSQGLQLRIDTVLPMSLRGRSEVSIPAFEGTLGTSRVNWGGLQGTLRFGVADGSAAGKLSTEAASSAAPLSLKLAPMELEFDYVPGTNALMVGKSHLDVARIEFDQPQRSAVESLRIASSTVVRDKALQWEASARLARATIAGVDYRDGAAEIAAKNLDAQGYAELRALVEAIVLNQGKADSIFESLRHSLGRLAARSPELELKKLAVQSSHGPITASASMRFDGVPPTVAENPLQAAHAFRARFELAAPWAWLEQVSGAENVAALLAKNLAVAEGGTVRLQVSYERGELRVNGKPFGGK